MRLCVVGPVYPLRGGIAQHTTLLCRHLAEKHEVRAVTFKRLYPSFLFPGTSQIDPSKSPTAFRADPVIDSMNPLTWISAGNRIRAFDPDCIITAWWHPFFGPCLASVLSWARAPTNLFLCHNILPHEGGFLMRPLALWALRQGDGFIVHSGVEGEALEGLLPGCRIVKTVLPEHNVFPMRGMTKEEARERLDLAGDRAILFFGLVRKYKGLVNLIRAMDMLRDMEITCMVVGEFYDKKDGYLAEINRLGLKSSFRIVDRYMPNELIEPYFAAADAVILPYLSATQSGVVQVSYQFERPVIATSVGGLPESVDDGRTGLLVPPGDPGALADAVRRFYEEHLEPEFAAAIRGDKGRFSWDRVIEAIEMIGASP